MDRQKRYFTVVYFSIEYDQEMPQSHTTDQPIAPWGSQSSITATWHSEYNKSKATKSLFRTWIDFLSFKNGLKQINAITGFMLESCFSESTYFKHVSYSLQDYETIPMGTLTNTLTSFVDHLCYFCLVLLCFHARLFVDALWSPAGKGLPSWLSFLMPYCDVVTFQLVSWVRCGT